MNDQENQDNILNQGQHDLKNEAQPKNEESDPSSESTEGGSPPREGRNGDRDPHLRNGEAARQPDDEEEQKGPERNQNGVNLAGRHVNQIQPLIQDAQVNQNPPVIQNHPVIQNQPVIQNPLVNQNNNPAAPNNQVDPIQLIHDILQLSPLAFSALKLRYQGQPNGAREGKVTNGTTYRDFIVRLNGGQVRNTVPVHMEEILFDFDFQVVNLEMFQTITYGEVIIPADPNFMNLVFQMQNLGIQQNQGLQGVQQNQGQGAQQNQGQGAQQNQGQGAQQNQGGQQQNQG